MDYHFASAVEQLEPSFRQLIGMDPYTYATLPRKMPRSGVYLFSEGECHLYVGRSRSIRQRLGRQCRVGATHRMGASAFRLAQQATGRLKASYRTEGSRANLMKDPKFREAFDAAKARIQQMDIRFVEETDPLRQTLLEVYVAIALQTPHNGFDTH